MEKIKGSVAIVLGVILLLWGAAGIVILILPSLFSVISHGTIDLAARLIGQMLATLLLLALGIKLWKVGHKLFSAPTNT